MTIKELGERLELKALTKLFEKPLTGVYISDMVSDVIANARAGNVLVTLQVHNNIIAAANLVDVAAIVLTRGRAPAPEAVALAEKAEITVFQTPLDSWQVATKLYESGVR